MSEYNKSFEDLVVWQKSIALSKQVYYMTQSFPVEEKYGLTAQIRRSTVSVSSNIAEGCARGGGKEFIRFLDIAQGSAAELKTQFIIACEIGFLKKELCNELVHNTNEVGKMLYALKRSISQRMTGNWQPATSNLEEYA